MMFIKVANISFRDFLSFMKTFFDQVYEIKCKCHEFQMCKGHLKSTQLNIGMQASLRIADM